MRVMELFSVLTGFTLGPVLSWRAPAVRDFLVATTRAHPAKWTWLARIDPIVAERFQQAALGWAGKRW